MAFCTQCGAKLTEGHRFCSSCGAQIQAEVPVASPIPEEPVYTPPVAEPTPDVYNYFASTDPDATVRCAPGSNEATHAEPDVEEQPAADESVQDSDVHTYTYAAPETFPAKKKSAKHPRKFGTAFCSVLICILVVLLLLPTFVLVTARNVTRQETLLNAMERIDLDEIPASVIDENNRDLKNSSIAEYICNEINAEMRVIDGIYDRYGDVIPYRWEDMTPKSLNRFLEKSSFLPFIAEHAEGMIDAMLEGKDSYSFSDKSIKKLIEGNVDVIIEEMNLPVDEDDYEVFADQVLDEVEVEDIELPEWNSDEQDILDLISFLLSVYLPIGLGVVMALLIALLFLANRKDILYAVRDTGITFVVGTALLLVLTLGCRILASIFAGEDALMYLVSTLVSCAAERSLLVIGIFLILGVVLLVANFIIRKAQSKRSA